MKKFLVSLAILFSCVLQAGNQFRLKEIKVTPQSAQSYDLSFTIEGGESPYTYSVMLSNGTINENSSSLPTGRVLALEYGVLASYALTDSRGATLVGEIVPSNNAIPEETSITYNTSCYESSTGEIAINVTGDTQTVTVEDGQGTMYILDPLERKLSTLPASHYTVTVTNQASSLTIQADLAELDPVEISATPIDTTCNNANGLIIVDTISGGGGGPYIVTLNPGGQQIDFPSQDSFGNLLAGMYTLTAVSEDGCEGTIDISVAPSEGVQITNVSGTPPSCFDFTDGTITVEATSDAQPPLTFMLDGQAKQGDTSATFTDLMAGFYSITVIDANGCLAFDEFLLHGPGPISFLCTTGGTCGNEQKGLLTVFDVNGGAGDPYTGLLTGPITPIEQTVPGIFENLPVEAALGVTL